MTNVFHTSNNSVNITKRNLNMTKSILPNRIYRAICDFHPTPGKMRHANSQSLEIDILHLLFANEISCIIFPGRRSINIWHFTWLMNSASLKIKWYIIHCFVIHYFRLNLVTWWVQCLEINISCIHVTFGNDHVWPVSGGKAKAFNSSWFEFIHFNDIRIPKYPKDRGIDCFNFSYVCPGYNVKLYVHVISQNRAVGAVQIFMISTVKIPR